jgi:flagellar hook-associated protein 3 FlgL
MSTPRITQRLMVDRSLASLQAGLSRLSTTQEQLSSGRVINRPSDSPTGTNDAMRLRAQIAADTQHTRNAQDGLGWMGQTDSTLSSMLDNVRRARDLIVQGSSTGSNGPDARAALAAELGQIRDGLVGLANTTYLGRPIFGGTTGSGQAYVATPSGSPGAPDTVTYKGDANAVTRTIGTGVPPVQVNVTGPDAFSVNGDDLFTVLGDALAALTTNPGALGGTLTRLDAVTDQVKTAQANLGARYNRVETALTTLNGTMLGNQSALSDIENVDLAKATMDLQLQQVAYQASLGATARVIQPSLLDFLR